MNSSVHAVSESAVHYAVGEKSSVYSTMLARRELAHLEMVATIVYQLTRNLSEEEIKKSGFDTYFADHTTGVYPIAASEFRMT